MPTKDGLDTARSGFTVRLRLWLEGEQGMAFGIGRVQLLEAVRRTGSLKAAAREMGMSYRAAWGKIKRTEEVLGVTLLEKTGGEKSSYRVTPQGTALLDAYAAWLDEVEAHAAARAEALFRMSVRRYEHEAATEKSKDVYNNISK